MKFKIKHLCSGKGALILCCLRTLAAFGFSSFHFMLFRSEQQHCASLVYGSSCKTLLKCRARSSLSSGRGGGHYASQPQVKHSS